MWRRIRPTFFSSAVDKYGHSGWSPLGSYLVTSHDHNVFIWGSTDYLNCFGDLMAFNHYKVEHFDVSPGEKYLVTYSTPKRSDPKGLWLKIFDVTTGKGIVGVDDGAADSPQWPVIRWAGGKDDKYFATLNKNKTIAIYETGTETFSRLGNNPLDLDNVVDISWSPTESLLAVLLKGHGNQRGKALLLLQIPDKVKLVETYLPPGDDDCKMHWQSNGDYLAVSMSSGFKFLSIKEEGIPTDFLQLDKKILVAFAWEPSGHRFAVIHKGDDEAIGLSVSFYSMEEAPGKVTELFTLHNKQANALFWSPRGKLVVLAGLEARFGGKLEFFDVERNHTTRVQHHLKANHVVWDPSGRYLATAFTIPQEEFDASYGQQGDPLERFHIWSSNGDFLYDHQCDYPLIQMDWRPYGGGTIDDDLLEKRKKFLLENPWF